MLSVAAAPRALKINGSTTVNAVAAEAAEILRREKKMSITVDTQGGSSGGISGVGDRSIDIGMSSKPLTAEDRAKFPKASFAGTQIGMDAVALVVSADVWNGGVRALTKAQIRDIYESKIVNWKQVGGPDRRIVFFNKEPGRGTWEVFAAWLYGDTKRAPAVRHPEVGGNEETRQKVAATRGAITQLSSSWAENHPKVKAIAIRLDDGVAAAPDRATIASGRYPLSRPLLFITSGPPAGDAKTFIDFVRSPRGQELMRKHGYLGMSDLSTGTAKGAR
ncbi:MAG TPA: substrate-binding domain-containing protein [Thermoanaerobaculia bacterium]|nr:substrate-binding domain-containing protein [Thermoanaerobaculia bacterium]